MLTSLSVLHALFFVWNCADAVSGTRPQSSVPEVEEQKNKEWAHQTNKEKRLTLKGKDSKTSSPAIGSGPWGQSRQNLLDMPKPAFAGQESEPRSSLSLSIFGNAPETPAVPALDRRASRMSQKSVAESIYALPVLPPPVPTLHLDKRHHLGGKNSKSGPDVIRDITTPSPVFGGHIRGYSNLSSSSFSPQFVAASLKGSSKALPIPPTSDYANYSNRPVDSQSASQQPRSFSPTRESGEILMEQLESNVLTPTSANPMYHHDSDLAYSPASSRPVSPAMTNRPRSRAWSFSQASMFPDDVDDTVSMIQTVEPFQELPRQSFGSRFSGNWMSSLTRGESFSAASIRSKAASTRSKATSTRSRTTSRFLEPGRGSFVPPMPLSHQNSVSGRSEGRNSLQPVPFSTHTSVSGRSEGGKSLAPSTLRE
jgi:hypothetical protein